MRREKPRFLVVDREGEATRTLNAFLRQHAFEVVWAYDGEEAFNVLDDAPVQAMLVPLRAPRIDGMALLRRALERHPGVCAVMISSGSDLERAVEAMRLGAYDFQTRPVHRGRLLAVLERGLRDQRLAARVTELQTRLDRRFGFERLVGRSRGMQRVLEQVRHVAPTRATVLIEGEAGSGKRTVAQAVHQNSPRKDERFVWVDCAALAPGLIESELFGSAPAGLGAARPGRFELAEGGTLYLDAVGDLPPAVQVKVLRLLQDRSFEPAGGGEPIRVDVRLIAGKSRDLEAEVRAGRFREDLLQRLSVARIEVPPLRERREDIPTLVQLFIRDFNRAHGRHVTGITHGALERLVRHPWPGNVRELRNALEGMVVFAEGRRPLSLSDLPDALRGREGDAGRLAIEVGMTVDEAERHLIAATLEHTGHDKPRAATMLGIGLRTLYRKIKDFGIG